MKHTRDRVIVLSRTDFGEKDRILVVLGKDHGRVTIIAKGTRSERSKLAGSIELFCESDIQYVQGKGSMHTLTGARLHKNYSNISKDIDKTMLVYEFLKLLNKTIEEDHGQEYYEILSSSLETLNEKDISIGLVKSWFYVRTLYESGHLPSVKKDPSGKVLSEADGYNYDFDSHCFFATDTGKYKIEDIKLLRLLAGSKNVPKIESADGSIDRTSQLVEQLVQIQLY